MAYLVELSDRAARDLEALYLEKNAADSPAAASWYNGLEAAVLALADHPRRSPVIPETMKLKKELRHLLYGKKPHTYRVICQIDEAAKTVTVLHIRHGARRGVKAADLA